VLVNYRLLLSKLLREKHMDNKTNIYHVIIFLG